jgi:hypothetical protein
MLKPFDDDFLIAHDAREEHAARHDADHSLPFALFAFCFFVSCFLILAVRPQTQSACECKELRRLSLTVQQ